MSLATLLLLAASTSCLPFFQGSAVRPNSKPTISHRQVGDGVNGNQTDSSGSITNSGGLGDGNGVGFAGTGNDIGMFQESLDQIRDEG